MLPKFLRLAACIGNARSVCEVQTVLANAGISKGVRIMSEAGTHRALELQIEGREASVAASARWLSEGLS